MQELGLCRFDQLHDMKVKKNQILIMPTWRMYIRNEISASDHELEAQKFMETDYYRYWDALLKDERLIRYIEENDLHDYIFIRIIPERSKHRDS
mgnify:CR=1 FL=1